jgi:NAD(P)H-hydrate epimerase
MKIVTSQQMRRIEERSQQAGVGTNTLMESAGLAVAKRVRHHLGTVEEIPVVVLVGPGNNGGDGLVAARHLHAWGARATVYLCHERQASDPNLAILREKGVHILYASGDDGLAWLRETLGPARMAVDAVLGTGRSRPIDGILRNVLLELATAKDSRPELCILALDLPTGLDADTGAVDPVCPTADITVALGYPKVGLYMFPGAEHTGRVEVVDIGVPPGLDGDVRLELMTPAFARATLPARPLSAHKGTFGRALVVAGSASYVGAAYLASAAAARSGAGLVTLAIPRSLQMGVAARAAEPTYIPLPEYSPGVPSPDAAALIHESLSSYDSLLVGCGMGRAPATDEMLERLLFSGAPLPPTVIDADGLNFLAGSQHPGWWEKIPSRAIVTPHPGEMARLTSDSIHNVETDRVGKATESAVKWDKVVVLKGAHTVVAFPSGQAMLSPFANPGLATAGTGDVLAGTITGLLAQGLSLEDGAALGVYLHGLAGERVRDDLGETGMIASDLLGALPRAIKGLGPGAI